MVRTTPLLLLGLLGACVSRPVLDSPDGDTGVFVDELTFELSGGHAARVTWIPSDAAGDEGVVVRVTWPYQNSVQRFDGPVPVVVELPGTTEPGDIGGPNEFIPVTYPGVVQIKLALPGGGEGEWSSGGQYDERGDGSVIAVTDVIRFALGELADVDGNTLDDIVGGIHNPDAVVVYGDSNGGNLAARVVADEPDAAGVCGMVLWETPVRDIFATVDIGGNALDPDPEYDADGNGNSWDDMVDPAYEPGSCTLDNGCPLDHSDLAWDGEQLFCDEDANGVFGDGSGNIDLNGNGARDVDEDFKHSHHRNEDGLRVYSLPVTQAIENLVLFDEWPDDLATVAEARDYWEQRSTLTYLPGLDPEVAIVVLGSRQDHVQAAPDHPHVWMAYEASRRNVDWARLNPDAAYLSPALGVAEGELSETSANVEVDKGAIVERLMPRSYVSTGLILAGVLELGDRCQHDDWRTDLDQPHASVPEAHIPDSR